MINESVSKNINAAAPLMQEPLELQLGHLRRLERNRRGRFPGDLVLSENCKNRRVKTFFQDL